MSHGIRSAACACGCAHECKNANTPRASRSPRSVVLLPLQDRNKPSLSLVSTSHRQICRQAGPYRPICSSCSCGQEMATHACPRQPIEAELEQWRGTRSSAAASQSMADTASNMRYAAFTSSNPSCADAPCSARLTLKRKGGDGYEEGGGGWGSAGRPQGGCRNIYKLSGVPPTYAMFT